MKKVKIFVLVLLSVIAISMFFLSNFSSYTSPDETVYLGMAKSLPEHWYGYIGNDADTSNHHRAPLLTYILAPFAQIGLEKAVPVLLAILSVLLVYFAGKKYFSQEFGAMSALFLATNHLWVFFSLRVLPEVLFGSLVFASVLLFWEAQKNKKLLPAIGLFVGLAFLTRYSAAVLPFIFFGWLSTQSRKVLAEFLKSKWLYVGIGILLLVLAPWFLLNLAHGGLVSGASIHLAGSGKSIPWDLTLKSLLVFGAAFPFIVFSIKRLIKEKHKVIAYLIFVAFFFVLSQDMVSSDLRYAVFLAPIFSFVVAYGIERSKPAWKYIFVAACLINLIIGAAYVASYSNPTQEKNIFSNVINSKSFFGEHKEYVEAAKIVKELSAPDEKILIVYDGGHYVYYYGKRAWAYYNSETDAGRYNIAYVTILKEDKLISIPEVFKNWRIVYDGKFVKVLRNEESAS